MNKLKFFATLCCAALLFAACDKDNEPLKQNDTSNDTKEAVDLGLSVKWATCNVGATSPEQSGNYYAWGETKTKENYSWDNYTHGTSSDLAKYNATDGKTTLEASDDAAAKNWDGTWRMPTDKEWKELINKCTWTWTDNYNSTGVAGYEVKATNGKSIFLPAAGYCNSSTTPGGVGTNGNYWSSSIDATDLSRASYMYILSGSKNMVGSGRCAGLSVRPVCE